MNERNIDDLVLRRIADRYGFLDKELVRFLAANERTRLVPLLVRMGGCRFTAAAQDVLYIIDRLEMGGDYCRDVSIPLGSAVEKKLRDFR
jgi:hypothetical protein